MPGARSYTKVARAQAEEQTRAALQDAAEEALFRGEWERVTLEALAGRAGVTKQTLLRHFGSREQLFEQAYRRGFERVRAQRLQAPTDDIDGAVDNLLDHYYEVGEQSLRIGAYRGGALPAEIGRVARALHYDWVEHAFGTWLSAAPAQERARTRAALIVLCDVQTWNILALELGLARPEVRAVLILSIRRLLKELP